MKRKKINSLRWLLEPLEGKTGFIEKPMFGCLAAYVEGRLVAVIADREAPWNGLLVPTSREFHALITDDFPALTPHPVLGKWLFISSSHEDFEEVAASVVDAVAAGDSRFGVEPGERRKSRKTNAKAK